MPKINVYLPDDLARAVRDAKLPVSAICQGALEQAVRTMTALQESDADQGSRRSGMLHRFTPRARAAVEGARALAAEHRHDKVGTEHVLRALLDDDGNLGVAVLRSLDVEPDELRAELEAALKAPRSRARTHPRFSPAAKAALALAAQEASRLGHSAIGCEHLLLGIAGEDEGAGGTVLRRMGVELRTTRRAVQSVIAGAVGAPHGPGVGAAMAGQATLDEIVRRLEAIEQKLAG